MPDLQAFAKEVLVADGPSVRVPYNKDVNLKFVDRDPDFPSPRWLTESQRDSAKTEWGKLSQVGTAPNYLAEQVIAHAKQRGEDPRLP
ncbi:MAG TPA: hypothetical protein VH350_15595 [Candidatus Sulfotelmatobacter sp.]|jgi:hypothetical protein|nr:hypothetical protein [Candidatus Sulfotelmatobacter sp.]